MCLCPLGDYLATIFNANSPASLCSGPLFPKGVPQWREPWGLTPSIRIISKWPKDTFVRGNQNQARYVRKSFEHKWQRRREDVHSNTSLLTSSPFPQSDHLNGQEEAGKSWTSYEVSILQTCVRFIFTHQYVSRLIIFWFINHQLGP